MRSFVGAARYGSWLEEVHRYLSKERKALFPEIVKELGVEGDNRRDLARFLGIAAWKGLISARPKVLRIGGGVVYTTEYEIIKENLEDWRTAFT